MPGIGKAEEYGYAVRGVRTIAEEEVDLSEHFYFADAARWIGHFIEDIDRKKRNHCRII